MKLTEDSLVELLAELLQQHGIEDTEQVEKINEQTMTQILTELFENIEKLI